MYIYIGAERLNYSLVPERRVTFTPCSRFCAATNTRESLAYYAMLRAEP